MIKFSYKEEKPRGGWNVYGDDENINQLLHVFFHTKLRLNDYPLHLPFVGHTNIHRNTWSIIVKPPGKKLFEGFCIDSEEYKTYELNPYQCLHLQMPFEFIEKLFTNQIIQLKNDINFPLAIPPQLDYIQYAFEFMNLESIDNRTKTYFSSTFRKIDSSILCHLYFSENENDLNQTIVILKNQIELSSFADVVSNELKQLKDKKAKSYSEDNNLLNLNQKTKEIKSLKNENERLQKKVNEFQKNIIQLNQKIEKIEHIKADYNEMLQREDKNKEYVEHLNQKIKRLEAINKNKVNSFQQTTDYPEIFKELISKFDGLDKLSILFEQAIEKEFSFQERFDNELKLFQKNLIDQINNKTLQKNFSHLNSSLKEHLEKLSHEITEQLIEYKRDISLKNKEVEVKDVSIQESEAKLKEQQKQLEHSFQPDNPFDKVEYTIDSSRFIDIQRLKDVISRYYIYIKERDKSIYTFFEKFNKLYEKFYALATQTRKSVLNLIMIFILFIVVCSGFGYQAYIFKTLNSFFINIDKNISNINNNSKDKNVNTINDSIDALTKEISNLKAMIKPKNDSIDALTKKISGLKVRISQMEKLMIKILKIKQKEKSNNNNG